MSTLTDPYVWVPLRKPIALNGECDHCITTILAREGDAEQSARRYQCVKRGVGQPLVNRRSALGQPVTVDLACPSMEVRDWVLGMISAYRDRRPAGSAGMVQPLDSAEDALACLNDFDRGGWSIEEEAGTWYLLTGDQWVGRSEDRAKFDTFAIGMAVAVALLRQHPWPWRDNS